jgi:hypothetical protein
MGRGSVRLPPSFQGGGSCNARSLGWGRRRLKTVYKRLPPTTETLDTLTIVFLSWVRAHPHRSWRRTGGEERTRRVQDGFELFFSFFLLLYGLSMSLGRKPLKRVSRVALLKHPRKSITHGTFGRTKRFP